MSHADPPQHTRLRGLVSRALTARRIKELRPRIHHLADDLIDRFATAGSVELMQEFAVPLIPGSEHAEVRRLLRYDPPVQYGTFRRALRPIPLESTTIPADSTVIVNLASANHDERHLAGAGTLDLGRNSSGHLSFGHGIHYCLGAQLARTEGQVAFGALLRRLPGLRLAVPAEELRWRTSLIMRGLHALPITFDAGP